MSFNIVNMPAERHTWLTGFIGLTGPKPGRVLPSGRNTAILSVTEDVPAQWLCGGATVWRQVILREFNNRERYARWAMAEDLLFSYPIGKLYPMFVCAAAHVRHEHVFDHNIRMKYRYYGRTETLWRFAFVESHPELSRAAFLWLQVSTIVGRLGIGTLRGQWRQFQFAFGQIEGVCAGFLSLLRGRDVGALLVETPAPRPTQRST